MSARRELSRREFVKLMGVAASAAAFGACAPNTPTGTATVLPEPTKEEIVPIFPEMVLVEAGSFEMGFAEGLPDEQSVHTVHVTKPFYIGKHEVTFEEFDRFYYDTLGAGVQLPEDDGLGRGNRPVPITWYEAVSYCNWLSEKEGLTPCYSGGGRATKCDFSANGYRLPTEAEWEYAARGGPNSRGNKYAGSDDADEVAWYDGNSGGHTHPVGQKRPNELGLYDMSGNLYEWCWDFYSQDYYASSPSSDPNGPASPTDRSLERVKRGGQATDNSSDLRTTFRSAGSTTYRPGEALRLVRTA